MVLPAHSNTVLATHMSLDGRLLAVGCSAESLRVLSLPALARAPLVTKARRRCTTWGSSAAW
jgi:hypothetical protein